MSSATIDPAMIRSSRSRRAIPWIVGSRGRALPSCPRHYESSGVSCMTGAPVWDTFERRMREVCDLEAVGALLVWDEQTYCSKSGHDTRAHQQAALASLVHERIVDGGYGELVDELADSPNGLSQEHRAMVRVVKHDRDRAVRLSPELVRALAAQGSRTNSAWEAAREQRDFNV